MKKYFLIFIALFFCTISYILYKEYVYTHIFVKFKELRPLHNNIPVYYKGINIGKTTGKKHSDDGAFTIIKLILYPNKLMFPINTTVYLKKEKKDNKEKDFLEFVYPKNPSKILISNYATLDGFVSSDMDIFLASQNPESIETIKENLLKTTQNLSKATETLSEILNTINSTLTSSKKSIINTSKNIENMTDKIDNSINQDTLDDTMSNIEQTSKNINYILSNANETLMPSIDSTSENVSGITDNINAITCGIRKTLRKKCGMIRLIFGQVIDECN